MSETTKTSDQSETVVICHGLVGPTEIKHVHDLREVVCKAGTEVLVMPPLMDPKDRNVVGHGQTHRYVRTKDKDELGRAIFRPEPLGS